MTQTPDHRLLPLAPLAPRSAAPQNLPPPPKPPPPPGNGFNPPKNVPVRWRTWVYRMGRHGHHGGHGCTGDVCHPCSGPPLSMCGGYPRTIQSLGPASRRPFGQRAVRHTRGGSWPLPLAMCALPVPAWRCSVWATLYNTCHGHIRQGCTCIDHHYGSTWIAGARGLWKHIPGERYRGSFGGHSCRASVTCSPKCSCRYIHNVGMYLFRQAPHHANGNVQGTVCLPQGLMGEAFRSVTAPPLVPR